MSSQTIRVVLTPHTHWDREWYEPFSVFSDRLVTMMDTLLDLGRAGFPHFHLDGQTAMIDDYLERRPEREDEVRGLIEAGRLSAGPWVAQMDEFLTSGESHIRNLEMGLARARELGGALEVGYMPDQFGHIGQMPQVLRMGGLERAMVWRGVPASIDRSSFWWEAPDGSRVLTEYMVFGYFNGEGFDRLLEAEALAGGLRRSVDTMAPYRVGDRMIVMVGYDHAGPDPSLPQRLAAAATDPSVADVDARVAGIAEHLSEQVAPDDLPVWRGELRAGARAHLLPNVVSARVHQKRERGRVEALIERVAEPLAAQVPGFGWPGEELHRAWTLLLWNGAHDSACGCSHDQVALDVDARFAEVRAIGEDIVERALTSFGSRLSEGGVIRYNPSPFPREGVPGNGWAVVASGSEPPTVPVRIEPAGEGVLVDGVPIRLLDEPDVGDLYTFCYEEQDQVPRGPDRVLVEGHEVDAVWEDGLRVLFRVTRRADEPFSRIEGVIRNERPDHRLRLHVGLAEPADGSVAGAPFELVERPSMGEGSDIEAPSRTWPARGVVMAGGRALLHEGVVEYEVIEPAADAPAGALALTLLRSVGCISREALATRPFDAGPGTPTPLAQMLGETAFAIGLVPRARREDLLDAWERFAIPLAEAPAAGGGNLPASGILTSIEGEARLSSIRRVDGALEVRLWNPWTDRPVDTTVAGSRHRLDPARILTVHP
jgi:alpha-mannosidase